MARLSTNCRDPSPQLFKTACSLGVQWNVGDSAGAGHGVTPLNFLPVAQLSSPFPISPTVDASIEAGIKRWTSCPRSIALWHTQYVPVFLTQVIETSVNRCVALPGAWEHIHHRPHLSPWVFYTSVLSETACGSLRPMAVVTVKADAVSGELAQRGSNPRAQPANQKTRLL